MAPNAPANCLPASPEQVLFVVNEDDAADAHKVHDARFLETKTKALRFDIEANDKDELNNHSQCLRNDPHKNSIEHDHKPTETSAKNDTLRILPTTGIPLPKHIAIVRPQGTGESVSTLSFMFGQLQPPPRKHECRNVCLSILSLCAVAALAFYIPVCIIGSTGNGLCK